MNTPKLKSKSRFKTTLKPAPAPSRKPAAAFSSSPRRTTYENPFPPEDFTTHLNHAERQLRLARRTNQSPFEFSPTQFNLSRHLVELPPSILDLSDEEFFALYPHPPDPPNTS